MLLSCNLRCLALGFAVFVVAACGVSADRAAPTSSSVTASAESLDSSSCGEGIQACSPAQSGQPCDPDDLSFLCVPQTDGAFCCLPVVQ